MGSERQVFSERRRLMYITGAHILCKSSNRSAVMVFRTYPKSFRPYMRATCGVHRNLATEPNTLQSPLVRFFLFFFLFAFGRRLQNRGPCGMRRMHKYITIRGDTILRRDTRL